MSRVKICGIQTPTEVQICSNAGADALGFVTEYPTSVPWNLGRKETKNLIKTVPPFISSVVVTTGSPEEIIEITDFTKPDIVQLHGEESEQEVKKITEELHSIGVKVLKAVSFGGGKEKIPKFQESGVDGIIVDSKTGGMPGGTGKKVDWEAANEIFDMLEIPGILAGGLTPENVVEAAKAVRPFGVDVISGVEGENHIKDPERVRKFVERAKGRLERGEFFEESP